MVGEKTCTLCGWWRDHMFDAGMSGSIREAVLREFDLNSAQLSLDELGVHLKRYYADVYELGWRRFEELLADVFRANGLETILTRASKDGGADVIVFKGLLRTRPYGIIECKKYGPNRSLTVANVRALVGCAVDWNVRRAWLATTARFTRPAKLLSDKYGERGYEVSLLEAGEILTLLEAYNTKLPRLHEITDEDRRKIMADADCNPFTSVIGGVKEWYLRWHSRRTDLRRLL
jgi:hypothetical protein